MAQLSLHAYIGSMHRRVEERIEEFINKFKPKWLYVDYSGGKDSTGVLASAIGVTDKVIATFLHIVGQTHNSNARAALEVARRLGMNIYRVSCRRRGDLRRFFIKERIETPAMVYAIVADHQLGVDYWSAVKKYGFPAPLERMGRGKRWCCSHFKSDWLGERPVNGTYDGRPARFLAVGIRRQESPYRAKLWAGKTWQVFENQDRTLDVALAPIVDLSDEDVWSLLKHYGVYDIVKQQYDRWKRAPNCMLCPLMGKQALRQAVANLPTSQLQHVLGVLRDVRGRYREGTFSAKKLDEWIATIEEELEKRNRKG